jgi:hypothetical protein
MLDLPTLTISMFPSEKGEPYFCLDLALSDQSAIDANEIEIPFPLKAIPYIQGMLNIRQKYDRLSQQEQTSLECPQEILTILQGLKLLDGSSHVADNVQTKVGETIGSILLHSRDFESRLLLFYAAAKERQGGNIVFKFDQHALELAALPWELAYYRSEPLLLHLGQKVLLGCVRVIFNHPQLSMGRALVYAQSTLSRTDLESDTLRIVVAVSHANMKEDDLEFEKRAHKEAQALVEKKFTGITVDFESLDQVKMRDLEESLLRKPLANMLEYYGHGHQENEHATLRMGSADRGYDPVPATRFKSLKHLPPFVIFHACNSAQLHIDNLHDSLAISLIESGVQAVIAMQFEIRMRDVTRTIIPTFYEGLANGYSLPYIMADIRRKLYAEVGEKLSWYVPVLYMRQFNYQPYLQRLAASLPPNPFTRRGVINPEAFELVGCMTQVQKIWRGLESGENLSIIGQPGTGKTAMLAHIAQKVPERLAGDVEVIRLNIEPEWKKIDDIKQALAQHWCGRKTQFVELLQGRHIILLLDNIGILPRNSNIPTWLRGLSENRSDNTIVQLVIASAKPLSTMFSGSPQPLDKIIDDTIELGPFDREEAKEFISSRLRGTGLTFEKFEHLLDSHSADASVNRMIAGNLEKACKDLYNKFSESLTKGVKILYS